MTDAQPIPPFQPYDMLADSIDQLTAARRRIDELKRDHAAAIARVEGERDAARKERNDAMTCVLFADKIVAVLMADKAEAVALLREVIHHNRDRLAWRRMTTRIDDRIDALLARFPKKDQP